MADNSITIRAMLDAYVADARDFRKIADPKTLDSLSRRINKHWGDLSYEEFCKGRNARARAYAQHRRDEDRVSDTTINREIRHVQSCFNFCAREELIDHAVPVLRPPAGPPRSRVLSRGGDGGELKRLMAQLYTERTPAHVALEVEVALRTGQRKGAILALKWEHVDFDEGMIYFSRTVKKETKKKRIDKPMSDALRALLLAAKERARTDHVIEFRGKPIKDGRTAYKALLARAGISDATFHDLRRTSATIVRHGLTLEEAASHIGDTIATTARVYAKEDVRKNLNAQNVIDQALSL